MHKAILISPDKKVKLITVKSKNEYIYTNIPEEIIEIAEKNNDYISINHNLDKSLDYLPGKYQTFIMNYNDINNNINNNINDNINDIATAFLYDKNDNDSDNSDEKKNIYGNAIFCAYVEDRMVDATIEEFEICMKLNNPNKTPKEYKEYLDHEKMRLMLRSDLISLIKEEYSDIKKTIKNNAEYDTHLYKYFCRLQIAMLSNDNDQVIKIKSEQVDNNNKIRLDLFTRNYNSKHSICLIL